jgi:MFS superfamily sulfate permease-like transporter
MKKHEIQKEFFSLSLKKLKENWKVDLISGFLVFLIALPLSLGIAMASSFPPMAGIIAAVVGGMIVAIFSGSHLTICGPAAGLIVVIIHGVDILGAGDPMLGYRTTLAAIVIAGFLQIFFGIMKSGKLSTFFPGAVVHGMMASIGIIIMSKQIHTMLGVKPQGKEIFDIIFEIPKSFMNLNPQIAIIGVVSLLMLIFIPKIPLKWIKKFLSS